MTVEAIRGQLTEPTSPAGPPRTRVGTAKTRSTPQTAPAPGNQWPPVLALRASRRMSSSWAQVPACAREACTFQSRRPEPGVQSAKQYVRGERSQTDQSTRGTGPMEPRSTTVAGIGRSGSSGREADVVGRLGHYGDRRRHQPRQPLVVVHQQRDVVRDPGFPFLQGVDDGGQAVLPAATRRSPRPVRLSQLRAPHTH